MPAKKEKKPKIIADENTTKRYGVRKTRPAKKEIDRPAPKVRKFNKPIGSKKKK